MSHQEGKGSSAEDNRSTQSSFYSEAEFTQARFQQDMVKAQEKSEKRMVQILDCGDQQEGRAILQSLNRPGGPCCAEINLGDKAWKCDTCSLAPNTIYCHNCFKAGKHEGHRASLWKGASGSCDCGVANAFKESGFCQNHKDSDPDKFECSEFGMHDEIAPAIQESIKELDSLVLKPESLQENFCEIATELLFLTKICSENIYCVLLACKSLSKISQNLEFKHLKGITGNNVCHEWVSGQLAGIYSWFKPSEYSSGCRCLRIDNLIKAIALLETPQKKIIEQFLFLLNKSPNFRAVEGICFINNFKYEKSFRKDRELATDAFAGSAIHVLADTLPCFLKAKQTQKFLFAFLVNSITRIRELKNFRQLRLVFHYLTQLFSLSANEYEQSYQMLKNILKLFMKLDCFISYPLDKQTEDESVILDYLILSFLMKLIQPFAFILTRLSEELQIKILQKLGYNVQKALDDFFKLYDSKRITFFLPSLYFAGLVGAHKLMIYSINRLSGVKLTRDPSLDQKAEDTFANLIVQKVYKQYQQNPFSPKAITGGDDPLVPRNALFHYAVNSFEMLFALSQQTFRGRVTQLLEVPNKLIIFFHQIIYSQRYFSENACKQLMAIHQSADHTLNTYIESLGEMGLIMGQAPLVRPHLEEIIKAGSFYLQTNGFSVEAKRIVNGVLNTFIKWFHFPIALERIFGIVLKAGQLLSERDYTLTFELYKRIVKIQLARLFGLLSMYQVKEVQYPQVMKIFESVIEVVPKLQSFIKDLVQFGGGEMVSPNQKLQEEIKKSFEIWSVLTPYKLEGLILQQHLSHVRLGILSIKNNFGIKNVPLYSEMRGVMSAFDLELLERSLTPIEGYKFQGPDYIYFLMVSRLFAIGLEPKLGQKEYQAPEDDIKKVQEIYSQISKKSKWGYLNQVGTKLSQFMVKKWLAQSEQPLSINPLSNMELPQSALQNALKVVKMFEFNCAICQEECESLREKRLLEEEKGEKKEESSDDDSILSALSDQDFSDDEEDKEEEQAQEEKEQEEESDQEKKQEEKKQKEQEEKAREILQRLVGGKKAGDKGKPHGYGCFVGSHNFIQKGRIYKVKQILKDKFNPEDWNYNQGYFYLNRSDFSFHYGCVKPLSKLDQREFSAGILPHLEFNCILPTNPNTPTLEEYSSHNLQTQVYLNAHSTFQFIASLVEHYRFMKSDPPPLDQRVCIEVAQMKKLLPELPNIIATYIADNAIMQTRLIGLQQFLTQELKCSVTLALVDNLKLLFQFFQEPIQMHLDKLPLECSSMQDLIRYGEKLERYVANLLLRTQEYDEKAQDNLRTLFHTYAQFIMEAKSIEKGMDCESLEIYEMMPLLESTAVLIIGRYGMRTKGAQLQEKLVKNEIGQEQKFRYLWCEILQLSQNIEIDDISESVKSKIPDKPILAQKELYEKNTELRALILNLSEKPIEIPFIPLPQSYINFQTQNIDKVCSKCNSVPLRGALCCFCGTLVCLQTECCKIGELDQAFQHAHKCTFGTGMFIAIDNGQFRVDSISSRMLRRSLSSPYRTSGNMMPGSMSGIFSLKEECVDTVKKIAMQMQINMISN